ncbi:MAG: hypothetical protein U0X91_21865 [Spirosomataceae bacterium]
MTFFNSSVQKRITFALFLWPLVIYVVFFEAIALNVNYIAYDDIHVLQIIEQWQQSADWREKLDWLTVGFPEHRIVFTRLTVLASYWIMGFVNLKTLMIISNLLWIGQLGFLFGIFRKLPLSFFSVTQSSPLARLPFAYFIPLCWIVLCVHSFENIFWGTSSLGNFGLLFFVMAAGYFYTQLGWNALVWALLFSLFATFTYGNGLLTFLIGGFILALAGRWRDLTATVAFFGFSMVLYWLTRAHASPSGLDLTNPKSYGLALSCFFAFIGSSANFNVYTPSTLSIWLSVAWGALLFGGIVGLLLKDITFKPFRVQLNALQLFALFLFLFVCLSALGVVFKRAEGDGLIGMFKGRYRMYPTWLLVVGYLLVLNTRRPLRSRWFLPTVVSLSIGFNLLILYYAVAPAVNNRRAAVAQEFNSMYNPDLLGLKMFDLKGEDFLRLQKLYRPVLFFKPSEKTLISSDSTLNADGSFGLDSVYFVGDNLHIDYRKDFIRPTKDADDGAYVLLRSPQHTYMSAGIQQALPLKTFLRRGWYWDKGFTATFHRASVAKGNYELYVLLRQNGINQLLAAHQKVTF